MAFIMVRILCQLRSGKAQCFMKNFLKFGKWWDEKNLNTQCWNSKKCRPKIIISNKNPPFPTTTHRESENNQPTSTDSSRWRILWWWRMFGWPRRLQKSTFFFVGKQWAFWSMKNVQTPYFLYMFLFSRFVLGMKPSTFGDFLDDTDFFSESFFLELMLNLGDSMCICTLVRFRV